MFNKNIGQNILNVFTCSSLFPHCVMLQPYSKKDDINLFISKSYTQYQITMKVNKFFKTKNQRCNMYKSIHSLCHDTFSPDHYMIGVQLHYFQLIGQS